MATHLPYLLSPCKIAPRKMASSKIAGTSAINMMPTISISGDEMSKPMVERLKPMLCKKMPNQSTIGESAKMPIMPIRAQMMMFFAPRFGWNFRAVLRSYFLRIKRRIISNATCASIETAKLIGWIFKMSSIVWPVIKQINKSTSSATSAKICGRAIVQRKILPVEARSKKFFFILLFYYDLRQKCKCFVGI